MNVTLDRFGRVADGARSHRGEPAATAPARHRRGDRTDGGDRPPGRAPAGGAGDLPAGRAGGWLAALLAGSAALFAVGLTWGLPSWHGWAGDELHPESWQRAITPETHSGWHARYPPGHFYVLHALSWPIRRAIEAGVVDAGAWTRNHWLTVFARLVSLAMALLTLAVVYRLGRYLAGRRSGLFAAAVVALTAPYVYYAKTANLEAPYLLWLSLSLLFYVRLLEAPRLRDALWFGVFTAAAVATKDQAYALYALAPLPLLASLAARQSAATRLGRLLRAVVDRRFLAAGASALLFYAVFQNVFTNRVRFLHHVDLLLGPMSGPYREFGRGLGDQLALAWRFFLQVVFALDPLLFAACAGGVAWVAVRAWRQRRAADTDAGAALRGARREAWLLGSLLLLTLSYYFALVAVIGFTFDRYVLPVCLILALAGGRFFSLLAERAAAAGPGRRRLVAAATTAVLVYAFFYAASVDARMLADSRYLVEAYVAQRMAEPAAGERRPAVAVGRIKHVPRFRRLDWSRIHRSDGWVLVRQRPHFVAINLTDLRSPREQAFVARMDRGELGYRRVLTHEGDPAFNLLWFGDIGTSQRFINPEIALWERETAAAPAGAPAP